MLIETVDLTLHFGGLAAVSGISLCVHSDKITGLIGPNGSGKTTFFNLITGFYKPIRGSVIYKGQDITGLKPHQIAKLGISRTFQKTSLFPELTVMKNIVIGHHIRTRSEIFSALFNTASKRSEERHTNEMAFSVMEFMNMVDKKDFLAKNLSYGDQRRLEIAIAMAADPELLLLDEPAAGMNPEEARRLVELISRIHEKGIAILLVDHNMKVVMNICEHIVVFNFGEKLTEGLPTEISKNTEVMKVYLGEELEYV